MCLRFVTLHPPTASYCLISLGWALGTELTSGVCVSVYAYFIQIYLNTLFFFFGLVESSGEGKKITNSQSNIHKLDKIIFKNIFGN